MKENEREKRLTKVSRRGVIEDTVIRKERAKGPAFKDEQALTGADVVLEAALA